MVWNLDYSFGIIKKKNLIDKFINSDIWNFDVKNYFSGVNLKED